MDAEIGTVALKRLSQRERQVLALIADSLSSKHIARRLGCSPRTVEKHRAAIAEKLGIKGAAALAMFYKCAMCELSEECKDECLKEKK